MRPRKPNRREYTPCLLEPYIKEALVDAAKRSNISMSKFMEQAIAEKLERCYSEWVKQKEKV